jgi:hypothetical protein
MDFQKLLGKLDQIDLATSEPKAEKIATAPTTALTEDAQIRVLAGLTSILEEGRRIVDRETIVEKKLTAAEKDKKEEMKVGDKKKSATGGTIEKTATGIKHTGGKNYSGKTAEKEEKKNVKEAVGQEGPADLLAAVEEEINNPGRTVDNLTDVLNATFGSDRSPEFKKVRAVIGKYLDLVDNAAMGSEEDGIAPMRGGNIARHIQQYDLTDYLQQAAAMLDKAVKGPMKEDSKPDFLDMDKDGDKKEPMKKAAKESFRAKFDAMVEAKKGSKPDFLDMDKDGDKKEPMKKAVADKKKGTAPKKGVNPFAKKDESVKESDDMKVGDKKKSSTGGTIEKTKTGVKHTAGKNYGGKAAEDEAKKSKKDESVVRNKKVVAESVEQRMSFKQCLQMVKESGGQQQIDPVDGELWKWAQRVASAKVEESAARDAMAAFVYERMGGDFQLYDVLSENQK